jgi:Domain of unknown function (DUF4815)
MPQSTDLNKSPYYDDFDQSKNYHKVLFKPGVTVQTRELTGLQSILQNQIEKFGSKFFNEGSIVIPGGFAFDDTFNAVEVEETYKGISLSFYYQNLVGKTLTGKVSGVTAKVVKVASREDTGVATTLYVKYQSSSPSDFSSELFVNGEELITNSDVSVGNSFIFAGSEVAKIASPIGRSALSVGSAAKIDDGVYFIRGYFVNVSAETIILEPYSNTPSKRVGLLISEEIIDSDIDSSLNDNAQGFSNFAAPGADRLKISTSLISKPLDDYYDDDFIELFRVENGVLRKIRTQSDSAFIEDILARRTFDESGNYYVQPYNVEILDSLNDRLGNNGLYYDNQSTASGSIPSNDLGVIKISPGKAYVKGYELATTQTVVDYPKPRSTKLVESSSSNFYAGNILKVNNVYDLPNIGITTTSTVELSNLRLENGVSVGGTIGYARIYDFELDNNAYSNASSQFNLYLFDIQTYTNIVGVATTSVLTVGSYIQGSNSGASGYAKTFSGSNITLYQVSGKFIVSENLIIDGIESTVSIGTVTDYAINDIKSIKTSTGFVADSVLAKNNNIIGPFNILVNSGTATITKSDGSIFANNFKIGDIIKYERSGITSSVYTRITNINNNNTSVDVVGCSTVPNVCTGDIGAGSFSVQNISKLSSEILRLDDSSLYSTLENSDISNVNLLNSNIFVRKQYLGIVKSGNSITLPNLSGTDYVYSPFDEERYIVVNANGTIESLTENNLVLNSGNKSGTILNLSGAAGPCKLITTQVKSNVSPKYKKLKRLQYLEISKTKYSPVKRAGLTYSKVFGTRIEDSEISLNVPDITQIHGIFESSTTNSAVLPWIGFNNLNSPNNSSDDLILGELIVGEESGAIAVYAQKRTGSQIDIIYKSDQRFKFFEKITFKETGYQATLISVNPGEQNIINEFILDNGQRKHFYDYGRIKRVNSQKEPSGRLLIYFDYFDYDSTDSGDLVTVNSYPSSILKENLPSYNNVRNTDTIDIRPRVSPYNTSSTFSPFEFTSRTFNVSYLNSSQIMVSNENFVFDYDFYLPRTDKLILAKDGNFQLVLGEPSEFPIEPITSSETLEIAKIISKPYVYDIQQDVYVNLVENKRYTMSDIRGLDSRVSNLEYYTSLSLLETSTQNLLIEDEYGFNRFKSGFFVDNFSTYNTSDIKNPSYRASIDSNSLSAPSVKDRIDLSMFSNDNQYSIEEIDLTKTNSNNLKKTGRHLSLNYNEVVDIDQPFASRISNVNPFNIVTWSGSLTISPTSDTWTVSTDIGTKRIADPNRRGTTEIVDQSTEISYARSRNVQFIGNGLKPKTKFNLSIDSIDLSTPNNGKTYAFPKLLEVNSVVGVFKSGETVIGYTPSGDYIRFRLCIPNHKFGNHLSPTKTFKINPYQPTVGISTLYGPQSTFLNIDTSSLQISNVSAFSGNALIGMNLYGLESKASATISNNRLISDDTGSLIGSIFIPDPTDNNPKFRAGSSLVKLTTSQPALGVPGETVSSAEITFTSSGKNVSTGKIVYYDPLAQTFNVQEENGIIPSSIDVFFQSKSDTVPVTLQIREVSYGIPGGPDKIVGELKKTLLPEEVNISNDGTIPTTFTFDSLNRLEGGKEYAIVLISDTDEYNVWIARMGEVEIKTMNIPDVGKVIINRQPSMGSLFKSQNGTTWTPSLEEDLKFTLKKCKFTSANGTAKFYNSKVEGIQGLSIDSENLLPENPIYSISTSASSLNDGRHILVFHPNHGMYSSSNKVDIKGVKSDVIPTTLLVAYGSTESGPISVANTSIFTTFDGQQVSPSNPGYIKIDDEIIKYEEVQNGQLLTITRGSLDTITAPHIVNSLVYKYEYNGVPLSKINTIHTILSTPKPTLDNYYIQVSAGSTFTESKFGGGNKVCASKNKQFNRIVLNELLVQNFNKTSTNAKVRTVTSTSINGTEASFIDKGFQEISIDEENFFDSPRMVCSKTNELQFLNSTQFTGNKSLTVELNLTTADENLSPIIDLEQTFITTKNYRINQPVGLTSYASDSSVNSNLDDPHSFIHISKRIDLTQSANSLKVLFSAYRHSSSDIRVLYKIFRNDSPDEDQVWQLINDEGKSDVMVPSSDFDVYRDYTYTQDNLPEFTGYQIKIVGTSNNQSYSPIIKNLRGIALK